MSKTEEAPSAVEPYEASVKAYYNSIELALDMLFSLLKDSAKRDKSGHMKDAHFFIEWGYPLIPSRSIVSSLTDIEELITSELSDNFEDIRTTIVSELGSIFKDTKSTSKIVIGTSKQVSKYVRKYDINTNSVDNYKVRYFMGLVVTNYLNKNTIDFSTHPRILRGISRLMMLFVMQATLKTDNDYGVPSDMFKKYALSLLEQKGEGITSLFGEYGFYLIFKNSSKCHKNYLDRSSYA